MITHRTIAVGALVLLTLGGLPSLPANSSVRDLSILAPASAPAGRQVAVSVVGARTGDTVTLVSVGSLGTIISAATAAGDTARFTLPTSFTRAAGEVTLIVRDVDATTSARIILLPGPVAGPVQAVVGARSIVADETDRSMAVAIPVDRWGNAVLTGTPVQFFRQDVDGATDSTAVQSAFLVAWREYTSGRLAGRDLVWVSAAGSAGHPVDLEEVAGVPLPFTLGLVAPSTMLTARADGRLLVAVQSSVLTDRFGNIEPDGTEVTLRFDGPGGSGQASASTIAGVARLSLQAPSRAGSITITASSRGVATASPLILAFPGALSSLPVTASRAAGSITVRVGLVVRDDGSVISDGTAASVVLTDHFGRTTTTSGTLANGYVSLQLQAPPGTLVVQATVLGFSSSVSVR